MFFGFCQERTHPNITENGPAQLPVVVTSKVTNPPKKSLTGLPRPKWQHKSASSAQLLKALSQTIAATPLSCRLEESIKWEFTIDTSTGRVFDFDFKALNSSLSVLKNEQECLKKQWEHYRYSGPELYQAELIRLSYIFHVVEGFQ